MNTPQPWKDIPRPVSGWGDGSAEARARASEQNRRHQAWYHGLDLSNPALDGKPEFEKLKATEIAERHALDAKLREEEADAVAARKEATLRAQSALQVEIDEYESIRDELHKHLKKVWTAIQHYRTTAGEGVEGLNELTFKEIHVPHLDLNAKKSEHWEPGRTTTQVAIRGYSLSSGKKWD